MSEQREAYSVDDRTPLDKTGNVIGIGDILRGDRGHRYKVLSVDHLQGSGSVMLECLGPVEPGWERRDISRYDLRRWYTIETKAVHEYPPSHPDLLAEYEHRKRGEDYQNEKDRNEAIRDTQGGVTDL